MHLCIDFSFKKIFRVKKKFEFRQIFRARNRVVGKYINIDYKINNLDHPRLGLTIRSKFAKAVIRNRFKRQIRESFRILRPDIKINLDINVSPRSYAIDAKSTIIKEELESLLLKIKHSIK